MQVMNFSTFKQLTRIEQSFFGLPFILAGACLPFITHSLPLHFQIAWLWMIPAFFAARIAGMAFNQVIDSALDAENPRTERRVVASGQLSHRVAYLIAWGALLLFLLCCYQINAPTLCFGLLAALVIGCYSYAKRVTYLCHLVLGLVHFLAPLMAWVAIVGKVTLLPLLLSLVSMTLIAGVDIIYALQDLAFDREHGVQSIPARFGVKGAQAIAQLLHTLCLVALIFLGVFAHFSLLYYLCPILISFVFLIFHLKADEQLRRKRDYVGFASLFFYCTVLSSSCTLFFLLLEYR